jgi:cold shock CspA family protein
VTDLAPTAETAHQLPAGRRVLLGTVASFDADRGLGLVLDDSGRPLPFHCTAIADGSRHIDAGAPVAFLERPGNQGMLEATGLIRLSRSA